MASSPWNCPSSIPADFVTRTLLKRRIAEFAPDLVLTWMSRATSVCPSGHFLRVARLGGYYDLKYYRACDHLIANTEEIVDYLVKHGWPREKASYLPNFVDEAEARPIDRAGLQTPPGVPVILALGRLHSDKAFDVLLDAMARVPRAHLWLAGEGGLDASLKAQSARLGIAERVHFLGWRTDGGSLLAAADCLVCPSRVEPLGNVILEGWIHKKPVVAAASTGPAGLIETEKTGLLVPMEEAGALAARFEQGHRRPGAGRRSRRRRPRPLPGPFQPRRGGRPLSRFLSKDGALMCGIAGVMMADGSAPDAALLDRLEKALLHRGPDGTGRYVKDGVGLVHARLAIIDLASGDQPLFGPRGWRPGGQRRDLQLCRTAEKSLPDADLRTHSDCEPILHPLRPARHGRGAPSARHVRLRPARPRRPKPDPGPRPRSASSSSITSRRPAASPSPPSRRR